MGEWNRIECFALGDTLVVVLNGVVVNRAEGVRPLKGRIQIQAEGAEILFASFCPKGPDLGCSVWPISWTYSGFQEGSFLFHLRRCSRSFRRVAISDLPVASRFESRISLLPPGQARRRACSLGLFVGSFQVVVPPGQARRKPLDVTRLRGSSGLWIIRPADSA